MATKAMYKDSQVEVLTLEGKATGRKVTLPGNLFDVDLNIPLIHQVVEAQMAAARQGTHATKTRGMVSGGGKKPYRQKGTGNARQGSIRAPHYKGGGVVHGPQPRDYSQRTPKKMIAGALRSALSDRARNGSLIILEDLVAEDVPSTKAALKTLATVTSGGKVLIVIDRDEDGATAVLKSYSNAPAAHTIWADQLNAYDVVDAAEVIFSEDAINSYIERASVKAPAREEKVASKVKALEEKKADKTSKSKKADDAPAKKSAAKVEEAPAKKAPAKKAAKAEAGDDEAAAKKAPAKKATKKVEEAIEDIEGAAKKVAKKAETAAEDIVHDVEAAVKKPAKKAPAKKAAAKEDAE